MTTISESVSPEMATISAPDLSLLPDELLLQIFHYLLDENDQLAFSLSCVRSYNVSMRPELISFHETTLRKFSKSSFRHAWRFDFQIDQFLQSHASIHTSSSVSSETTPQKGVYIAGSSDPAMLERLKTAKSTNGLKEMTKERRVLATMRRTRDNVRRGLAERGGIYTGMHVNAAAIIDDYLWTCGSRTNNGRSGHFQQWSLSNLSVDLSSDATRPLKQRIRPEGVISAINRITEDRLVYGSWSGKLFSCTKSFGERQPYQWIDVSVEVVEPLGKNTFIVAGNDSQVMLFDLDSPVVKYTGNTHDEDEFIWTADCQPKSENVFVAGGTTGQISVYDQRSRDDYPVIRLHCNQRGTGDRAIVRGMQFRSQYEVVTTSEDPTISLWDLRGTGLDGKRPVQQIKVPTSKPSIVLRNPFEFWGVTFVPANTGDIYAYDSRSWKLLYVIDDATAEVQTLVSDGSRLVAGSNSGAVRIYDFSSAGNALEKISKSKPKGARKQGRSGFVKMR